MNLTMMGAGYVGLTTGTCFANLGNNVICCDVDQKKIDNLQKGILPFYEPGLKELVELNVKESRLTFTTNAKEAIERSEIIFICVGTPQDQDGSADLRYVFEVAKNIALYMNDYKIIVDKSTVPVGTAAKVKKIIEENQKNKIPFDVVSNPEFLREGAAIKDFQNPDRVIMGVENGRAKDIMIRLYKPVERTGKPIMLTKIPEAELIKYASNAMLATRISFVNQLSHLCEKVGANISVVAKGVGLDSRIGSRFLHAGIGYGGSCFPKDVKALIKTLEEHECDASILKAVDAVNEKQKISLIPKIKKWLPDLTDKKIAVWGLAFKPKTDDMRDAPSILLIQELQKLGATIKAFDPVAMDNAKQIFTNIDYGKNPYETIKDCDALLIATEWDEFRELDKEIIKRLMKQPIIIDGRNIYDPEEMKALGFHYVGIGR